MPARACFAMGSSHTHLVVLMKGPHTAFHCVCLHVWAVGRVAACWASVEGFVTRCRVASQGQIVTEKRTRAPELRKAHFRKEMASPPSSPRGCPAACGPEEAPGRCSRTSPHTVLHVRVRESTVCGHVCCVYVCCHSADVQLLGRWRLMRSNGQRGAGDGCRPSRPAPRCLPTPSLRDRKPLRSKPAHPPSHLMMALVDLGAHP